MRIAVYTIALNEKQFINSWYESAKEADVLLIADTGSTDGTIEEAEALGIAVVPVSVSPWRFDVARNTSLALLPKDIDYCIALDMDEVLLPGWREELEKAHEQGITRPRYKYTWSWTAEGAPGLQYGGDKIHTRSGYRWKHPVHEVLTPDRIEEVQGWFDLEIHHHPDNSKPRSQYLPLLALAVKEDPADDRNAHYYARELFFNGRFEEAKAEFMRHLELPTALWAAERAASMRYIAKCSQNDEAEYWFKRAIEEAPGSREPYVELAMHYYSTGNWEACLSNAEAALAIKEKPLEYLCDELAWNERPYDLAAISAHNLGKHKEAITYGELAIQLAPNDTRLQKNLTFYKAV